MQVDVDSDGFWLDRLCLRYGFREKTTLIRDLRDIRGRIDDPKLADRFLDMVARSVGETLVPALTLTSLDRLIAAESDPVRLVREWLESPAPFLEILKLLGTTPFVAKLVMAHHASYREIADIDFPDRAALVALVRERIKDADSDKAVAMALHRQRGLWTLRIAADDLIRGGDVPTITARLSDLADACLDGALNWCLNRRAAAAGGPPRKSSGEPCSLTTLALGKLGGREINYSSDVDLIFVYDEDGRTVQNPSIEASEHFGRVIGDFLKIMAGAGCGPAILRVDLRLRPEGSQGPMLMSLDQTLNYYDSVGRTWERQALIKTRPCAGDLELGAKFVRAIEPFVYRRYLSAVEIAEIQALKRRIENRAKSEGVAQWDVKTGYGGIRDIEFVVQFLQLLNGCALPAVRHANTIRSLNLLKAAGSLTPVEHDALLANYVFLRQTEHRLQLEEDRQTHRIPQKVESRRSLAMLMGFAPLNAWENPEGPFERFLLRYVKLTEENNGILNRLLHDAFRTDETTRADPVSDLILDPEMPGETQERILGSFGLIEKKRAIQHLGCMAREEKPYFSTPRCRHFFAAIAPKLLQRVALTPNPDATLAQIDSISQVLPVKALLWESLSSSTVALEGFVRSASENRFVAEMIHARPIAWEHWYRHAAGIDREPEDYRDRWPSHAAAPVLERQIALRSERDDRWLAISASHPLPMSVDAVRSMSQRTSQVAEGVIRVIARSLWDDFARRSTEGGSSSAGSSWAIVALGKLGAESLAIHSDLDLMFVHQIDGSAEPGHRSSPADHQFDDLASRFLKAVGDRGPGFLYRVDTRLRPFGKAGSLSVPVGRLRSYYRDGGARVWERMALLRARPVFVAGMDSDMMQADLVSIAYAGKPANDMIRAELASLRDRIRKSIEANADDIKRCDGGSQAIELYVQALQLSNAGQCPGPPERDEWAAIERLRLMGALSDADAGILTEAYGLYRQVDWAIRLYRNRSPEQVRIEPKDLPYLTRMIDLKDLSPHEALTERLARAKARVRAIIDAYLEGRP